MTPMLDQPQRPLLSQADNSMEAELSVGFRLFTERYTSRVTLERPSLVRAEAFNTQLFESLVTEWRFQPGPQPVTTWVDFRVEFSFKSALYAQAAGMFLDEVGHRMVNAFEEQCAREYGHHPQIHRPQAHATATVQQPRTGVQPCDAASSQSQAEATASPTEAVEAPGRRRAALSISSKLSVTRPTRTKPPPPLPHTGRGLW